MYYLALLFGLGVVASLAAAVFRTRQSLDPDVKVRRWETRPWYGAEHFARWLRERPDAVKEYAALIARYDYALVLCYGGATIFASLASTRALQWPFVMSLAVFVLPGLYMAADWGENALLTRLFAGAASPTTVTLLKLRALTVAKWLLALAALFQTYVLYKFI